MEYSAVPKNDRDNAEASQDDGGKPRRYKCCCCRLTKKQIVMLVCLLTLGPIVLLAAAYGITVLVYRLTYNPPPPQFSSTNDTIAFLSEVAAEMLIAQNASAANVTVPRQEIFNFQTTASPPWTNCGSSMAIPRVVQMERCELDDSRCVFDLDAEWMVEIAFTMKPDVAPVEPTFEMCGKGTLRPTPCQVQQTKSPNPCEGSNLECPLQAGKNYLYRNIVTFSLKGLPFKLSWKAPVDLYFKLKVPDNSKPLLCVRVPTWINPEA